MRNYYFNFLEKLKKKIVFLQSFFLKLCYFYAKAPKYLSASKAAIQPVPAAVTACLYSLS